MSKDELHGHLAAFQDILQRRPGQTYMTVHVVRSWHSKWWEIGESVCLEGDYMAVTLHKGMPEIAWQMADLVWDRFEETVH